MYLNKKIPRRFARVTLWLLAIMALIVLASGLPTKVTVALTDDDVTIIAPDDGEILDGVVLLQANVASADPIASVEFFYDPHEDDNPEVSLGLASFNATSGFWELEWDTTSYADTYNDLDSDGDGVEDLFGVNITKPPTHDRLRVLVTAVDATTGSDAIDVRLQNMLTVRFTLPDNTEDLVGFNDLEAVITGQYDVTSVRFDVYSLLDADPRIFTPFGETLPGDPAAVFTPIENPHYGRPLGTPTYPTGSPLYAIGDAAPQGARRWVLNNWDTTTIPDCPPPPGEPLPAGCDEVVDSVSGQSTIGYALVATAEDSEGRLATYTVEVYILNDLRVVITAPDDGATVSRFVALEARTSSMTGADNALAGGLWPATAVDFTIGATTIPATETPAGSGRWRAVWDGDSFAPGPYTITANATNANPGGAESASHSVDVTLVAPGPDLEAFFNFDWGNCHLFECGFLDNSGGGPTSWLWDFGDGNTSTDQNPVHTYATYGIYTVSLTVSNDGGTTTDTYSRAIPVGNTGVVGFNVNPLDDAATLEIDWTSAFKNFEYVVGDTLAIPVMWKTTPGSTATFNSMPTTICDDDETTSNQECVIFTPEEANGTAPTVVGAVQDGVLFTMSFTEVQYRGVTDIFKGKANVRIVVDVDLDNNGSIDQTNQLGTNVDVTNSGTASDEQRSVAILSPFEGQYVGGLVPVSAGVVSTLAADQVEFFLNGSTSLGVDTDGSNGWAVSWNTTALFDGPHQLTAVATFAGTELITSAVRNVTVQNTLPGEPPAPDGTFQTGRVNDTTGLYITYPFELEEEGGGGPPGGQEPTVGSSMTAEILSYTVLPGDGLIGGDAIELDILLTNTSTDPDAVLTAFAFQSKFSESPALASRIGDKAFYGVLVAGAHPDGPMTSVKKNGTANGLFGGRWKGICINSSTDFIPEFNSGIDDESLECAGNRADANFDGLPELQYPPVGIYPGQSQTVRVRIEAGTTDGALHVVEPGTLRGAVQGIPMTGPNGISYFDLVINNTGITDPNVIAIPDWSDNKVLRDADGTFNPTFAPLADGYTFANQQHLTLPRVNFAFTDILGRNHTCESYGLDHLNGIPCSGNPGSSPIFGFDGNGDLLPGIDNFAAILHGFGEYAIDADGNAILDGDGNYLPPMFPYDTLCVNPDNSEGLRCGARPFTPIAEFYKANSDGTLTQQMVAGSYGALGSADQYTAYFDVASAEDWKEEVFPEPEPGGPCDPISDPDSRRPSCAQLHTSATGHFYDLMLVQGGGINGGDAVQFTIDIANTSANPAAYLTAFNYQSKARNLADVGGLDGFTQDRRDIRVDSTLNSCVSVDDGACYNASLGVGQFPNVIGNGLLFGQMVWPDNIDRIGREIIPDMVYVDPVNGIVPITYWLESVKKNGPFSPILKGNINFICVKSGLFGADADSDTACAGQPAILVDSTGEPVPGNIAQRLGIPPGGVQSVRVRMEWGDFRGAILQIAAGTLTDANVRSDYVATQGLARDFDCSDQRELEYCHPFNVGTNIGYLPNTTAEYLTPETLEDIEWVIINQPGDAPTLMNFQDNFGLILAMAGFIPTAEFYAPDPNPDLVGTPHEGILIRQQVLGTYAMKDVPATAPLFTSTPSTNGTTGTAYSYDANAIAFPGPITFSLDSAPSGMTIDGGTGLVSWTPGAAGNFNVAVRASNGTNPDAVQSFQVAVVNPLPSCQGQTATIYVNDLGRIVGGPDNGRPYRGILNGTGGNDVIVGTSGNDTIKGRDGNDLICAGDGNDNLDGGNGDDTLYGEGGNDALHGSNGNDTLYGGPGDDLLYGGNGHDRLYGGDGNDRLYGNAGNDMLYGEGGNDILYGGGGNDTLFGGDGDDAMHGESGRDSCDGGPGIDTAATCETVLNVP
jgi:PKD repeat protein